MKVFRWHEWMSDLAMDTSKPFERQVLKVVPDRILYTETWLWKLGLRREAEVAEGRLAAVSERLHPRPAS